MERRLTAILAADVVGYSRLMAEDEEATLSLVQAHRADLFDPKVAENNGRIIKLMGDGTLVEFSSVIDAVNCAIAIQSALAETGSTIRLRIGINLGDVILESGDIYGDGVNIAARLESLADPGGVCISDSVHQIIRGKIDIAFSDMGEQTLKNIDQSVRVWQWLERATASTTKTDSEPLELPDKPSIAVLPFSNMSGDPEQEFFADGMTEDIITELSRFEELFVIAWNTSFTYKGQRVTAKEVAEELGIQFVLEGSVRKAGQKVRISAQLINGRDGSHIWAERYDGHLEDVFDLQEQVTSQVVSGIALQINEAEMARMGQREGKFDSAYELAWSAQEMVRSGLRLADPSMLNDGIAKATEAIEINSRCGIAYQSICFAYAMQSLFRWGDDPDAAGSLAEDWAKKFQSRMPQSYMAYHWLGMARVRNGEYQNAMRDFRRAHELNANDSTVLSFWAWCEASAGEFESAKEHAHMALRLSPKDRYSDVAYLALAMSAFIEKDAVEFEEWAGKAIQSHPNAPIRRAMMIAYAAESGNEQLLKRHLDALLEFAPDFIGSLFRGDNRLFQKPEHMNMLLDGLRKAGLPT